MLTLLKTELCFLRRGLRRPTSITCFKTIMYSRYPHQIEIKWNFSVKWRAAPTNTLYQERDKNRLVGVYWSVEKKFSHWICNKIIKNDPRNTVNWIKCKQTLVTSYIYKKFLFNFYRTDLVNTKTTTPLRVGSYIALDIYPPVFTSPLGDSCI